MTIFWSRRASARSFSMCLNSSCVVEPTSRSWPVVRIGLMSVAEIHRPACRGAGADRRVDLVDEEDWHRALRERMDDSFEALLEVAAEPRASEQRAGVERENLGALEQIRDVVSEEPGRQAFGESRLADAGVADEHRVVLSAAAQNLHCPLELIACGRSAGRARRRERVPSGLSRRRPADRGPSPRRARRRRPRRPPLIRSYQCPPDVVGGTLVLP